MISYEAIEISCSIRELSRFRLFAGVTIHIPKTVQTGPALLTHHPFVRSLTLAGVALKYLGGAVA